MIKRQKKNISIYSSFTLIFVLLCCSILFYSNLIILMIELIKIINYSITIYYSYYIYILLFCNFITPSLHHFTSLSSTTHTHHSFNENTLYSYCHISSIALSQPFYNQFITSLSLSTVHRLPKTDG